MMGRFAVVADSCGSRMPMSAALIPMFKVFAAIADWLPSTSNAQTSNKPRILACFIIIPSIFL